MSSTYINLKKYLNTVTAKETSFLYDKRVFKYKNESIGLGLPVTRFVSSSIHQLSGSFSSYGQIKFHDAIYLRR